MLRLMMVGLVLLIFVSLTAPAVLGEYIEVDLSDIQANVATDGSAALNIEFKIAGMDDRVTTMVTAIADATAVYACGNDKKTVTAPVSVTKEVSAENWVSIQLTPPRLAQPLDCPGTQVASLFSVSYSNIALTSSDVEEGWYVTDITIFP